MRMNMARKGVLVLAAAGIALGTAAYAGVASAATTVARPHSAPVAVMPLKVALVAPSATNDLSWTQTIYAALESLKSSQHLTVSVSANEYVTSDAANILREYASDGYNLVIAHGSQYGSTIEQLAPEVPEGLLRLGHRGVDIRQVEHLRLRGRCQRGRLRRGLHGGDAQQDSCPRGLRADRHR